MSESQPSHVRPMPPRRTPWDRTAAIALGVSVFLSGWSLLRVGPINLTFSDVAFLSCAVILLARGRLNVLPFGGLTPFWLIGLAMMLGGLFASSIINGDALRWVNVAAQYAVAFLLIPIVVMQQEETVANRLPLLFVLGITLSEAVGIVAHQFLTFHDTLPWLGDGFITGNGRVGAMSGQPNPNGAVVSFALPMLIWCVVRGLIGRAAAALCGAVLVFGLLLSASFTGFFATCAGVTLTLALMGLRHVARLGFAVVAAGALFLASGAPLPATFQQRVGGAVESGDIDQAGTYLNRAELIGEAWRLAETHAFLGLGVDRYREISAYDNPVHDLYLLIWVEGGAVAFIGLLVLLGLTVLLAAIGLPRRRAEGAMALAVAVVFLVYTVSYPHMYSRIWIMPVMIALGTIYARGRRGAAPAGDGGRPAGRIAPAARAT